MVLLSPSQSHKKGLQPESKVPSIHFFINSFTKPLLRYSHGPDTGHGSGSTEVSDKSQQVPALVELPVEMVPRDFL